MVPSKTPPWPVDVAYDELPGWMRRTQRAVDWPLVLVAALLVVALAPLLAQSGLPWSAGLRVEIARALEISRSIQDGIAYPRWAGDLNLGYGSPLWNYLPPLPHYLAGLHHVLAQTTVEFSVKFTLIAAFSLLIAALFGIARRRWGTYAGLVAVALALSSPQIALVKPILEADLGALWGGAFFLTGLWALDRLLASGRGVDLLAAAGACAAVWLAHQPLNLVFSALLVGWLLRAAGRGVQAERLAYALLASVLGFLASAFYWLPAWSERGAVTWHPLSAALPAAGSVAAPEVFGWPAALDRAAINPAPTPALGVALWGAALLAILVAGLLARRRSAASDGAARKQRAAWREALWFGGAGAALLVAALPPLGDRWVGRVVWPPFEPSDLLFPAALCWALAGATLGHWLEFRCSPGRGAAGMLLITLASAGAALPASQLPDVPGAAPALTVTELVQTEARGVPLSARAPGWLLPRTVETLPPVAPSLVASYQSGAADPVAREALPPNTLVDVIARTGQSARILVRSAAATEITLHIFMADGWRIALDGRPLPARASQPEGFIAAQVPEGRHELQIAFGTTLARAIGWGLSAAAAALLLGLSIRLEYVTAPRSTTGNDAAAALPGIRRSRAALMLGMTGILAGAIVLGRAAPGWLAPRAPRGIAVPGEAALPRAFQGGIELLAFDLEPPPDPSAPFSLTLYWRGARPDLPDFQVDLSLARIDNPPASYALAQRRHPGLLPSSQWPRWSLAEHYVRDAYTLALPRGIPPGRYQIAVQVGRCSQLAPEPCEAISPLFVHDGPGASLGQAIRLPADLVIPG